MNAPYWGVLSPRRNKRDSIAQQENCRAVAQEEYGVIYRSGSPAWLARPDRFSSQTDKTEAPTLSTLSPTPSDIPIGGLAPRPSSLIYGTTDNEFNFSEKRRQRQSRYQEPPANGNLPQAPLSLSGLAYPDLSSQSHSSSNRNDSPTEFQEVKLSGFNKTMEQSPDMNDYNLESNIDDTRVEIKKSEHGHKMSSANIVAYKSKKKHRLQKVDIPLQAVLTPEDEVKNHPEFAPDRSPLQMLEMTLDSITKEEIRARALEAELEARKAHDIREIERSPLAIESRPIMDAEKRLLIKLSGRKLVEDSLGSVSDHYHLSSSTSSFSPKTDQAVDLVSRHFPARSPSKIGNYSVTDINSSGATVSKFRSGTFTDVSVSNKKASSSDSQVNDRRELAKSDGELAPLRDPITKAEVNSKARSIQNSIHRNHSQSLEDNEYLSSPIKPPKQDFVVRSNLNSATDSKPVRRGTFSKLSRLGIEKFFRTAKTDLKPSLENCDFKAEAIHTSDNSSPRYARATDTLTEQSVTIEDHQFFGRSENLENVTHENDIYVAPRRLEEWKKGAVAQLSGTYLDLDFNGQKNDAGKEKSRRGSRNLSRRRNSSLQRKAEAYDGEYDDNTAPTRFKPPLFLRCGPMLRYCGLRREVPRNSSNSSNQEREIWRGSVMIVCQDSHSSYELAPTLRLFLQPVDLLPPRPTGKDNSQLAPEYFDPIAGLSRIGRDGRTLYVRSIEEIDTERDLSREESADGLYDMNRIQPSERINSKSSQKSFYDGEKAGKYKEVRGFRLHTEQGMTFWRFNLEIELRENQQRIAYRINRGPASGFWVPPRGRGMNIMFYGCNSFGRNVNFDKLCGPDPMWRDVLNTHQTHPFHVMLGGGNQICNDDVIHVSPALKAWLDIRDSNSKAHHPFSSRLQHELEAFYLNHYCMWFSQGLFGLAVSQIPMVNMLADNDIAYGFGSRYDRFMCSPVFSGVCAVAFKYYMLFQHQSSIDEGEDTEPSWILGEKLGPLIPELSRTIFTRLGRTIAFLGLDCRTEMTPNQIIRAETSRKIFERLQKKVIRGDTKHLLVLMSIPHAHLRPAWLEKRNSSRIIQPLKDLKRRDSQKTRPSINGEETWDESVDHWITRNIREERKNLIQSLQDLAAAKSVRITILGGDFNMGAIGLLYSNPKLCLAKTHDFRYMLNVISSSIADCPISETFADLINNKNKVRHLDAETDEDMVPIFIHNANGQIRVNHCFLNCRNWCSIREYSALCNLSWRPLDEEISNIPPRRGRSLLRRLSNSRRSSAVASCTISARGKPSVSRPPLSNQQFFHDGEGGKNKRSNSLSRQSSIKSDRSSSRRRTFSLTRKSFNPVEILRHVSKRKSSNSELSVYETNSGDTSYQTGLQDSSFGRESDDICYFPTLPKPIRIAQEKAVATDDTLNPKPLTDTTDHEDTKVYSGMSTLLDRKQTQNGKYSNSIDLESGLEICLNMEIDPKNPAGATMPYRLIVPTLICEKLGNSPKDRDDLSFI